MGEMEKFMTRRNTFAMFAAPIISEYRNKTNDARSRAAGVRSSRRLEGLLRIVIGLSLVRIQPPPNGGVAQLVERLVPFQPNFLDDLYFTHSEARR